MIYKDEHLHIEFEIVRLIEDGCIIRYENHGEMVQYPEFFNRMDPFEIYLENKCKIILRNKKLNELL